ncbi:MAG: restriction endonuclease [Candidatus Doudnabacteria bacterium CG10_big_fil_rev_8_21_14_0_10_41_10]|uniref:Cytosine-specific methyltransferase n=1 Tax=Candidatus Doudnabacteria bacterium CG10_big_fil_rev_8_21_14_0_10_41_10 TaxID=1974551 RepID=A0A2H0VCR3_9BACT|nr:MAG: restriction endonuclease [Candidatus Doudnabacteria bacterium CG10_big_fil_rev_8_21_14_0_10_41_10]
MQHNSKNNPLTYISLFSSAGVGCYGFKQEEFECVATNEIIERRLNVQKHNHKCRYESGYISEDITTEEAKNKIRKELDFWKENHGIKELDVLIATPPCQGMSVANHKKGDELSRNSLVVESVKLVNEFNPKFFLFENVRAFLNSVCTDVDGKERKIREAIELNLGGRYNIHYQVINFKDYGNPSSRTRTLVLGVRKDMLEITPLDFMPTLQGERTVREVIGDLKSLKTMGEVDENDIYHNFRPYAEHMLAWIENTKEGESAFDNKDQKRRPHKVVDDKIVFNTQKNGDKYSRCYWDKAGACVHTRNDILASQATVHPSDNRVFSVREVMRLMSVPDSFRWTHIPEEELNKFSLAEKQRFLKKEEMNIRQSLGEAVPTVIFRQVAENIRNSIQKVVLDEKEVQRIIDKNQLYSVEQIKIFVKKNIERYSYAELSKIIELANAARLEHAAYYTRQDICFTVIKDLPDASKFSSVKILEPSAGAGNFLPLLIEKYKSVPEVQIDLIDIDPNAIEILKVLIQKLNIPSNFKINFINEDFLLFCRNGLFATASEHYDIVVGNPPFGKLTDDDKLLTEYKKDKRNQKTNNLFSFFLEKAMGHADTVALIIPKSFLSTPEFNDTREYIAEFAIEKITDYGEKGFRGVKIETISLILNTKKKGLDNQTLVESYVKNEIGFKEQKYICSPEFPYWLVYRDTFFDNVASKLNFGVFVAYRDRQITKRITRSTGRIRVLKSRNIGSNIIVDIPNYDSYIDEYDDLAIGKYVNHETAVLVPNLTYNPRACFLPEDTIVDGSVAVLIPKGGTEVTEDNLAYYNSKEFVEFYRVARNYGTRSLNIDNNSVFFFGLAKTA